MLNVKTILHPTDFSEGSDQAFRLACSLARDNGARLVVLHVLPVPGVVHAVGVIPTGGEERNQGAWELLHQIQPGDSRIQVEHQLAEGDPTVEILRTARETAADAIVLGTHGRTGLARLLMGSVAEQVVRGANCPVITVKNPRTTPATPEESPAREVAEAARG